MLTTKKPVHCQAETKPLLEVKLMIFFAIWAIHNILVKFETKQRNSLSVKCIWKRQKI